MSKKPDGHFLVVIDGMEYPIDLTDLTGREVGILKRVGHIGGIKELGQAMQAGDLEALAAVAGIAMERSGITNVDYDKLLDLKMGEILAKKPDPTPAATAAPTGTPSTQDSTA